MSQPGKYLLSVLALSLACTAHAADLELTTPDGRRVLLKDDKTWHYVDGAAKDAPAAPADKPKDSGEALLSLEGKVAGNRICRFQLKLVNNLPYEIRSLVPEFSVYRGGNVVYDSVFSGFAFVKPGDSQKREVRFNGIACEEITRVQVGGGDRCEMGDLDKFSSGKGRCLALVRVLPSEVVRFDK